MDNRRPSFLIVKRTAQALTIRDVGPWDEHLTVTNGAEQVVEDLLKTGDLVPGQRLFYYGHHRKINKSTSLLDGLQPPFGPSVTRD